MSACEIYAVHKDGNIHYYDEANNAWGGAMYIWNKLSEKYKVPFNMFSSPKIWQMYNTNKLSECDNLILGSTFDRVICKKEKLSDLIEAFKSFCKEYPSSTLQEEIEIMQRVLTDDEIIGIAWCQTSVSSFSDMLSGGYDEEKDERIPYNIFKQTDHWFLDEAEEKTNE